MARLDDGHHPFLGLAHQDLFGAEGGIAERYLVELDEHAAVAGAGQLRGGAGQPGAAEVLDPADQPGGEELQRALDQQLLHEGVAHLHARPLARLLRLEGLAGQHADATDAVAAGGRAVQDHPVPDAPGPGQMQVLVPQNADTQRVDQRVTEVAAVEDDLAADVGQAQAVAVAADPGHHARQHPRGVRLAQRAEPERVHHPDRPSPHGQDVADDAPDAGGRTLVRLDIAGVVVRLDLEGHRVAQADVHHPGVLADPGQEPAARGLPRQVAELTQVHLGGLVRAVLGPHHRVHGQLGRGRPPVQNLPNPGVLVRLQAEFGPRLRLIWGPPGVVDSVNHGATLPSCSRSMSF